MAKKRAVTKAKLDRVALIVRGDSVDQNQNQDEGELHTGGLARLFGYK